MTTERAHAYGRIMRTLRHCGGAAADDVARLREACATLVFACMPSPRDHQAMPDAIVAVVGLVAGGSISSAAAAAIVHDIGLCPPPGRRACRSRRCSVPDMCVKSRADRSGPHAPADAPSRPDRAQA
jgi:hypothetical protein